LAAVKPLFFSSSFLCAFAFSAPLRSLRLCVKYALRLGVLAVNPRQAQRSRLKG
jgi:hypothetical protein